MKITVIGSGVYGKAMANLLVHNNHDITIWTENMANFVIKPDNMKITNSFKEAVENAQIIYILTGSKFVESVLKGMKPFVKENMLFILGSKGILDGGILLCDVFEKILPDNKYAVISGPTFAVDIGALEPLGFTLATKNKEDYDLVNNAMKTVNLEYSNDIIGTELAGTLKNAYAIGSGILGGFNYGNSIRCLYITKVLKEMKEIFNELGAKEETVLALAGVGDLVLTCTSLNSRNFTFGSLFALGDRKQTNEYLKTTTVEGYENLKVFKELFQNRKINAPILSMVYNIVVDNTEAEELIELLIKKV